jgi:phospholipase/carboxylesterase
MDGKVKRSAEELRLKPVRELRTILMGRKVDVTGIADKEEFIKLIIETEHLEPTKQTTTQAPRHQVIEDRDIAGLKCAVLSRTQTPSLVVILLHGYGANRLDLATVAQYLLNHPDLANNNVMYVMPEAPLPMPMVPTGKLWWELDLHGIMAKVFARQYDEVMQSKPPGMESARDVVLQVIAAVQRETKLPTSRIILGGFSQGAILAMDVCLNLEEQCAGLLLYSGVPFNLLEWMQRVEKIRNLRVFQSHGYNDTMLPYFSAEYLRKFLSDNGAALEFNAFQGGHEINLDALQKSAKFIKVAAF